MVQQALPEMEQYEKKDALARTPMQLIELLVEKGGSADQLAVLYDIQLKYEANKARKEFEAAFEQFKRNAPEILKTKKVSIATRGGDEMGYSHAELHKITEQIGESLRAVGIVHQWKTSDANGRTTVTCVLKGFGHTEEAATLSGPSDTSGGKNNIQAIGSTVTYLQRYTLLSACGLAAKGMDNDGKTEGLPQDTITDYVIQMQDCSDFDSLKGVFKECWDKAKKADDKEAKARFERVYNEQKKNLLGGRQ